LASSEQKVSEQTRSVLDIVPKSFLSIAKCLVHLSVSLAIQSAASSELASSKQLASELQIV